MPVLGVPLEEEEARRRALEAMASGSVEAPSFVPLPAGPPASRVAVASGVPQEVVAPPRDEYGEALAEVRRRDLGSIGGDIGSGIIKAFTGVGRDPALQQALDAQKQAPVVEYLQRQKMADEKRRLDLTAQKASPAGARAKSTDPMSPESKRAQGIIKGILGDQFTDEQIAQMTEADADSVLKYGTPAAQREVQREGQLATSQRAKEKSEQERSQFAQMMGYRWADMSQEERLAIARLQDAREGRDAAAAAKAKETTTSQAKDFGTAYAESGLPDFYEQFGKVNQIFTKYPKGKGLPGTGMVEGRLPDRLSSDDAKTLRYAANQMLLAYQKSVTGAGASDTEREAITKATGLLQSNDDASIRLGVSMLKEVMDAKLDALKAGYTPEAVEAVTGRLRAPPSAMKPAVSRPPPAASVLPKDSTGQPTLEAPQRSPKDEAALAWARAHPTDPRAATILQRLGERP